MAIIGGSSGIVPGQLLGTTTNDSASAGNVGEIVTASLARASATALTTGAFKTVTSVSLTSGDWDVFGMVGFVNGATTNVTVLFGNWSLVNNTQDTTPGTFWQISSPTTSGTVYGNDMIFQCRHGGFLSPARRQSISWLMRILPSVHVLLSGTLGPAAFANSPALTEYSLP